MCDNSWKDGAPMDRSPMGELKSPASSDVIHASANCISVRFEFSGTSIGGDLKMLGSADATIHSGKGGMARYSSE